ncbi:hypothetical protein GWI33_010678 [Rhynchophorus ferrugineus]|uniref:Uncharacterized protein n=1 Tax=Rhynchophorus ferrugineus TaxID=354439 RepID=A0A834IQF8_RHYFE|nr:hypothetical protein GWI33_010678 [Rhynchophorus ferrugineus]
MKGIICLLFILHCVLISYAGYNSYTQETYSSSSSSASGWSDYSYSIREGSCSGRKVVQEDIVLEGQEYTIRKRNYSWMSRGMYRISCVRVTNNMLKNAAETRITEGGLGYDYVKIEMTSKNSKGLDFTVEIWGEENSSRSNIAVIANTVNREIFVGGEKYCKCS